MKEQILQLKQEGKTYRDIQQLVGCSLSTISYYCGENQKEKNKLRQIQLRKNNKYILSRKIDTYIGRVENNSIAYNKSYQKRDDNHKAILDKLIKNPICYLTGRKIDLSDGSSYHIDHINPYAESKDNSIDNAQLACRDANMSKSDMSLESYLKLCKEVLEYNGYKITKKSSKS